MAPKLRHWVSAICSAERRLHPDAAKHTHKISAFLNMPPPAVRGSGLLSLRRLETNARLFILAIACQILYLFLPSQNEHEVGLIGPMSKADAADSDSTGGNTGNELIHLKPGQSGNPKGRPQGSRNKLSEEFLADVHASWQVSGRSALMTAAITDPVSYVRDGSKLDAARDRGHHHPSYGAYV